MKPLMGATLVPDAMGVSIAHFVICTSSFAFTSRSISTKGRYASLPSFGYV